MRRLRYLLLLITFLVTGAIMAENYAGASTPLELKSPAFTHGQVIPEKYTGDGTDVSPPLQWGNAPEGTKAYVLISDDPDAPVGTWVHWVVYDIPADVTTIDEGLPTVETILGGAKQGMNDFNALGYGGPAPPPGPAHRYFFKLYALSAPTGLGPGASKEDVLSAIDGKILGEAELVGTYQR